MLLAVTLFIPLIVSLVVYLSGNKLAKYVALAGSLLALAGCVLMKVELTKHIISPLLYSHNWISNPVIHFSLMVDGLSLMLIGLTTFLVPLIIFTTYRKEIENAKAFYALILLMEFGLLGVFMASDGFLFYIFWEIALIPIYFIALLWGDGKDREFRNRAIFKFFVYTIAGSLFMLLGFIYIYQITGSFDIRVLYNMNLSFKEQTFIFLALFAAFAVKIPIFPFHTWQPETYKEAPSAGTMLLAGIMLKMGLYGLLRWLLPVAPHAVTHYLPVVIVLCIIGVIYGSVIAIKQDNLKKLFAYSSLAHVGLISAGIFSLTREGFQGAGVQMFAHGFNVVGLFFAAEIIYQRTGTLSISQLGGIRSIAPKFATCFMIVVLASVALPTTNGFIGEFLLLFGIYQYNTWLGAIAALTIILAAVYLFRMYQNVMLGETKDATIFFPDLTAGELLIFVLIIISIFQVGLFPKMFMTYLQPSLDNILNFAMR